MGVSRIAGLAGLGVVLAAGAAQADSGMGHLSGTLTGTYDRYDTAAGSANQFDAQGSAVLTLDNPGGNIQINFANSGIKAGGKDTDNWNYGGDAYWRDYAGEFGVNVTENTFSGTTTGHDYYTGGFFGEFYMLSNLTLRAKGGRVQGDFTGWYGDTGLVFYPLDQIAISMTGDYARFQHDGPRVTDGDISIEYLPVRELPISVALGYTFAHYQHVSAGFSGNTNIFSIALKAYFGGGGRNGGLVDYQRNGATDWDAAPSTIVGTTF